MATLIAEDCINCGACEDECPNGAISMGEEIFVIDPDLCTECVGFSGEQMCALACPPDVCVQDRRSTPTRPSPWSSTPRPPTSVPVTAEAKGTEPCPILM
jgi:ferredoxin